MYTRSVFVRAVGPICYGPLQYEYRKDILLRKEHSLRKQNAQKLMALPTNIGLRIPV